MICNFCGNKIEDNAEFCFICGQKASLGKEVEADTSESVFSQMQQDVPAEAPVDAPVETPVEAPAEEVVAETPEEAQAQELEQLLIDEEPAGKKGKKAKKEKKVKEPKAIGKFLRFLCFISTIVSFCTYKKALKKGSPERQQEALDLLGMSVCWKLGLAAIIMINKYML
ncbi:MAG: hypothetical protein R3Y27_03855 [Clostridia bacterium]